MKVPSGYRRVDSGENIRCGDIFYGSDPPGDPPAFHAALSLGWTPAHVHGYEYFRPLSLSVSSLAELNSSMSVTGVGVMTKAETIREEIGVSTEQVQRLNGQLIERFKTSHHREEPIVVDLTGGNVTFLTSNGCPMENEEALRMARWIIEMLG